MADYQCHPLWDLSPGKYGDLDPASLPISKDLQQCLLEWAAKFDAILNMADPASSGFESPAAEEAFKREGYELAERLRTELGSDYTITTRI